MPSQSGLYRIRVKGQLGKTALSAFPSMESELKRGETVLSGRLKDQAAVFAVVAEIEALGLELLELSLIQPPAPLGDRPMVI